MARFEKLTKVEIDALLSKKGYTVNDRRDRVNINNAVPRKPAAPPWIDFEKLLGPPPPEYAVRIKPQPPGKPVFPEFDHSMDELHYALPHLSMEDMLPHLVNRCIEESAYLDSLRKGYDEDEDEDDLNSQLKRGTYTDSTPPFNQYDFENAMRALQAKLMADKNLTLKERQKIFMEKQRDWYASKNMKGPFIKNDRLLGVDKESISRKIRDNVINRDDQINLKIALNTSKSLKEFFDMT